MRTHLPRRLRASHVAVVAETLQVTRVFQQLNCSVPRRRGVQFSVPMRVGRIFVVYGEETKCRFAAARTGVSVVGEHVGFDSISKIFAVFPLNLPCLAGLCPLSIARGAQTTPSTIFLGFASALAEASRNTLFSTSGARVTTRAALTKTNESFALAARRAKSITSSLPSPFRFVRSRHLGHGKTITQNNVRDALSVLEIEILAA
jgi:hypothetical protein